MRVDLTAAVERNLDRLRWVTNIGVERVPDDSEGVELWPCGEGGEPFLCEEFWFGLRAKVVPEEFGRSLQEFTSKGHLGLYIAAQIADYVRERLYVDQGYTCSIGVSVNKMTAKMIGNKNKPNGVTVLVPEYIQTYLDPLGIRMIPGFGNVTVRAIESFLRDKDHCSDSQILLKHFKDKASEIPAALGAGDEKSGRYSQRSVSILEARSACSEEYLARLFNSSQGEKLWKMLHGRDDSPVVDTPDIPKQVTVEDTYGRLDTADQVYHALVPLVRSLLLQLIEDCMDENGYWIQVPTTFILTVSGGLAGEPFHHRRVRSCPVPRELIDVGRVKPSNVYSREHLGKVAAGVVRNSVMNLFREFVRQRYGLNIKLINVGVTNFVNDDELGARIPPSTDRRQRRLDSYFDRRPPMTQHA
jgi:DNA polymerase iota